MPESFELTADQLAAAHQLAGIEQADFGQAPAPDVLAGAGVLDDSGHALRPGVEAALRTVRDPAVLVQAVANRAGEPVWPQAWIATAADGPIVVQTQTDSANVYRSVDDPDAAATALVELTGVTAEGGEAGALPTLSLGLAGFGALVALADAVTAEGLRSRLERRPADAHRPATAEALREQLEVGASSIDSSWIVTAALPITPVDLRSTADRLGDGVAELVRAGVLVDAGDGPVPSPGGHAVLAALTATTTTIGCYFPLAGPDGQPTLDHVAVLGSPGTTWVAEWSQVTASDAHVELRPGSAADGTRALTTLLARARDTAGAAAAAAAEQERLAAEQAAAAAEQERREAEQAAAERERHAAEQDRAASEQAAAEQAAAAAAASAASWQTEAPDAGAAPPPATPEPVAEAAPESGWAPTHRVPAVGMWAWNEPDAAAQPAAALDPQLEVQATEQRGEWVRVVCSNGWAAWVDGRQLVAR